MLLLPMTDDSDCWSLHFVIKRSRLLQDRKWVINGGGVSVS